MDATERPACTDKKLDLPSEAPAEEGEHDQEEIISWCNGHIYVKMIINEYPSLCAVDTGASRNLISKSLALKLGYTVFDKTNLNLVGVTGNALNCLGQITVTGVKIGMAAHSKTYEMKAIVIETMDNDLIMGSPFLENNRLIVDYFDLSLKGEGLDVPLIKISTTPHEQQEIMYLVTNTELTVNSKEFKTVPCQVEGSLSYIKPSTMWYEPDPEVWDVNNGMLKEGTMINVHGGHVEIDFHNPNTFDIKIPKGTILGSLKHASKEVVQLLDNEPDPTLSFTPRQRQEYIVEQLKINIKDHLTDEQKQRVKKLIIEFEDIFSINRTELGTTHLVEHVIKLSDESPIQVKYRPVPLHMLKLCEAEVNELLELGIIEESTSNYSSPVVMHNKNGKKRLLVDFRELNRKTTRSYAAIPSLELCRSMWANCKYFSSLDFRDSFYQIKLAKESQKYSAFTIPGIGHFSFRRLPQGLNSSPNTFNSMLDKLLTGLKSEVAQNFIDDLISAAKDFDTMMSNMVEIFKRLRSSDLKLNPHKCSIFEQEVKFLGVIMSNKGMDTNSEKVKSVQNMALPKTKKQLQSFIGGASWFRMFIKDFAAIAKPLTDALHGPKMILNDEAIKSFQEIKDCLTSTPILIFPDVNKTMLLYTDCSGYAMGASIGHEIDGQFRPIAYASKVLSETQVLYATFKREMCAMKTFIQRFRFFTLGRRFKVFLDHKSISHEKFMQKGNGNVILSWILELEEYDFEIIYTKGESNELADMMSRLPSTSDELFDWYKAVMIARKQKITPKASGDNVFDTIYQIAETIPSDYKIIPATIIDETRIKLEQSSDKTIQTVIDWIKKGIETMSKTERQVLGPQLRRYYNKLPYLTVNSQGILCRLYFTDENIKTLICLPENSKENVYKLNHDNVLAGHPGPKRTEERIKNTFWFPNMTEEIKHYCNTCPQCFKVNLSYKQKPSTPLKPFCYKAPGLCVAIDLVGPISSKDEFKYFITYVDRFTGYIATAPLKDAKSTSIAQSMLKDWICHNGCPAQVMADNAANLQSSVMNELYEILGIDKKHISAYCPQSNGRCEVANKHVVDTIKKMIHNDPQDWHKKLPMVNFALNAAVNSTTGFSPYYLHHGYEPRLPHDLVYDTNSTTYYQSKKHLASTLYHNIKSAWDIAGENISKTQYRRKTYYDRKTNSLTINEGDYVALWRPKPRQKYPKFITNFKGPYLVTKKHSLYNYEITDTSTNKKQIVHHNHLRLYPKDMRWNSKPKLQPLIPSEPQIRNIVEKLEDESNIVYVRPSEPARADNVTDDDMPEINLSIPKNNTSTSEHNHAHTPAEQKVEDRTIIENANNQPSSSKPAPIVTETVQQPTEDSYKQLNVDQSLNERLIQDLTEVADITDTNQYGTLTDQLGEPTPAVDSENNQDTDSGNNDTSTVEPQPQSHGYGLRPKNKNVQYAE